MFVSLSQDGRRTARALAVGLTAFAAGFAGAAQAQAAEDPFDVAVRNAQTFTTGRLNATTTRIATTAWPIFTRGLRWTTTGAGSWTSGFLSGTLWNAYQATGNTALRTKAQNRQTGLAGQAANTSTHDVGLIIFDSFGNGYRLTGTDSYRQTALKAAASLATRYSPTVGSVRSWNSGPTEFKVIIDNMVNLELLFWASKHGGQRLWYDEAVSHALKTAQNHVRPDGSTYHLVIYDPATGAVKSRQTVQGFSATSTWARGQAWAVHGFTMAYRETKDLRFLETARRVADWFIDHLPADRIPYWDFNAPGIPNEQRDTSAAAIAASGLLELSRLDPDPARSARYLATARAILAALIRPPWLSQGSGSEAVLLHGTYNKPGGNADTGLIWGDYFLQEALVRLRKIPPAGPALRVVAATASANDGNVAANAVDGNLATRWSASGDGQWLRLDLGAGRLITKVAVAYFNGDVRASRFDLQTSSNGTTWTTRAKAVTSATTLEPETYDIPDTTARYVRLLGHGAAGTPLNAVTEMAVYG
jgi:unsaturated chondroitin disaccharide hydrolase